MSENTKQNLKRNRSFALEARTLFDGSAIFDMALNLDNVDGPDVVASESVSSHVIQSAEAAVSAVESNLLSANRDDIFASFSGGQTVITAEWNSALDQLQSDMADGKVSVALGFLGDSSMEGNTGLFSAEGPDGNPVIYLNQDWIDGGASNSDIEAVISEKLGEFVDSRLTPTAREVYFIDASLADVQTLINAVPTDAEIFMVEAGVDGFAFMAETLANESGISAIHVLGHGSVGEAQLGSVTLSDSNLDSYSAQLAAIGQSLTAEGDILLYGCNVAASGDGEAFIQEIATLTQADVAASDDVTGAGGDWELEVASGSVESVGFSLVSYKDNLAISNAGFETDLSSWSSNDAAVITGSQTINAGSNTWVVTGSDSKMIKLEPSGSWSELSNDFQSLSGVSNDTMTYINDTFYSSSYMTPTNMAYVTQTFSATAGETYTVAWNYISTDYEPYNDGSILTLVDKSDPSKLAILDGVKAEITLLGATNPGTGNYTTGSYGSTGWQESTIQITESGTYTISLAVFNLGDTILSPHLYIDNIAGTTTKNGTPFDPVPEDPNAPEPAGDPVENLQVDVTEDTTLTIDVDGSDAIFKLGNDPAGEIKFATLPDSSIGIFKYNGAAVSADTAYDLTGSNVLTFEPASNANGSGSFSWTGRVSVGSGYWSSTGLGTITVSEVNDAPTISAITYTGALVEVEGTGNGAEEASSGSASGTITVTDPDSGDSVTLSETYNNDMVWVSGGATQTLQLSQSNVDAIVNGFVLGANSSSSTWTYSTNEDLNFLGAGDTLTFSYNVKATDGSGVNSSVQTVTITITGAAEPVPITISDITVKETDTYAQFEVNGTASKTLAMDLSGGTATGGGTDYGTGFEYSLDGGSNWVTYTTPFSVGSGVSAVLVRVPIVNDSVDDDGETFDLNVYEVATSMASTSVYDAEYKTIDISGLTLVSGTANSEGAVYRAANAVTINSQSIDVLVSITGMSNVSSFTLDNDGSNSSRFQPEINSTSSSGSAVDFTFSFVKDYTGPSSYTAVALENFYVSGVDVDGSSNYQEYAEISGFSSYQVDKTSKLDITEDYRDGFTRFSGITSNLSGITFEDTASYQTTFDVARTSVDVRLGVTGQTSGKRLFSLTMGAPVGTFTNTGSSTSTEAVTATATILQPDGLSISDATVNEGAGKIAFTVIRDSGSGTASVNYSVVGNTATVGTSGKDITPDDDLSGTVIFADGDTTKTITLNVTNDNVFEGSENFYVNLSNAVNLTLDDTQAVGTILDNGSGSGGVDDDRPSFSVNDVSVNESAGTLTFTVSKTEHYDTLLGSTVYYTLESSSATAGEDFVHKSGTLDFSASDLTKTVTVTLSNDSIYEGSEQFFIKLSNPTNAIISDEKGVATIWDDGTSDGTTSASDDDRPSFSIGDVTVNEEAGYAIFTVTKSGNTAVSASVQYATTNNGTADSGDYVSKADTLNFAKNETTKIISVAINDDAIYEGSETFGVVLSNASGATISDANGVGTIKDDGTGSANSGGNGSGSDDDRPTFTIGDATEDEGGTLVFDATLSNATKSNVEVAFTLSDVNTEGVDDYGSMTVEYYNSKSSTWIELTASSGKYTLPAGYTQMRVSVTAENDSIFEGVETFTLSAAVTDSAITDTDTGTGTIYDDGSNVGDDSDTDTTADDDRPSFSVDDVDVNEDAGTITFTVTKTGTTSVASSVNYQISSNSAAVGSSAATGTDVYGTLSGTLSFAAGVSTQTVVLNVTDDSVYEGEETFYIDLSSASQATISDAQGVGAVWDNGTSDGSTSATDDDRPSFSVDDVTVNEGAGTITFAVVKTGATTQVTTLDWIANSGTGVDAATVGSGGDITGTANGSLSFAAGETTKYITLTVANDTVFEDTETFTLDLSNVSSSATISDAQAIGTIEDDGTGNGGSDDDRARFTISDEIETEGNTFTFTVSRSGDTSVEQTIQYATSIESGDTAETEDFTAASGTLTFAAGSNSETFTVSTVSDSTVDEGNESLTVTLSNNSGGTSLIDDAVGEGIISDGTARRTLAISDAAEDEGGTLSFDVTLDGDIASDVEVGFSLVDITTEGSADINNMVVSYNNGSEWIVLTPTAGKYTLPAGGDEMRVTVDAVENSTYEGTETFRLVADFPNEFVIDTDYGTGTIYDDGTDDGDDNDGTADNDKPSFSINDVTVNEASGTATFTVTKSGNTELASSVEYSTSDGTAESASNSDYTAIASTQLNFAAGETEKTVTVTITNDSPAVYEGSETFNVVLANASGAVISDATGVGTIKDDGTGNASNGGSGAGSDDDRPTLTIGNATEDEGGTLTFDATLSNATQADVEVEFTLTDVTTEGSADYGSMTVKYNNGGTLTTLTATDGKYILPAGNTQLQVSVTAVDDSTFEGVETFTLSADVTDSAITATDTGTGSIYDDGTNDGDDNDGSAADDRPSFSVNDVDVNEGAGTITFTVTKTGATAVTSTVNYAISSNSAIVGSTAASGTDASGTLNGTLQFAANVATQTVTLNIANDNIYEGNEQFYIDLSSATQATISDSQGIGEIWDNGTSNGTTSASDDDRPSFSINDVTVNETDGTATFTITKTGNTEETSTVSYSTADVSAVDPADYTTISTTQLTFAANETEKFVTVSIIDDETGEVAGVWEGTETFNVNLSNVSSNAVIGDGTGVGTILDPEDRTVQVSGIGPINENSTYAVFEIDAVGGNYQDLTFEVFNKTATLVNIEGSQDASVSFIAPGDGTKFYVGVTIANEDDNNYEGLENFGLKAYYTDDPNIQDTGYNLIVDDGTGVRYDYANVPNLADSLNLYELDNDLTGVDSGGKPLPKEGGEDFKEVVVQKTVIDYSDAFKEVKESLDAYGLADAIATEAQSQIDKLSGKIALYVLPAVAEARSDTVSLFRRLASDDGNAYMGSSVVRSSLAMDSLAPISELSAPVFDDGEELQQGFFGEELTEASFFDSLDDETEEFFVANVTEVDSEHQEFTAQLLAAAKTNNGAGISRSSAHVLNSVEPVNSNLKDSNS
ncbi:Calx-beta domain-containing protein [Marinobacterium sp. LSUCC0821]|uniref:Calx-beta domain-containing protein n=1 Tax=Marinobacterium sp. LSUCC0821 TaxID=2668067 RepID=UPI001451ABC7|nr:Calx-beta domain-containing protein [Marinobacterium sp. LSUCC0821]QJD71152.1 DUF4347 domain-containing protein [Marinobacterium sp. LSUCC0821]